MRDDRLARVVLLLGILASVAATIAAPGDAFRLVREAFGASDHVRDGALILGVWAAAGCLDQQIAGRPLRARWASYAGGAWRWLGRIAGAAAAMDEYLKSKRK